VKWAISGRECLATTFVRIVKQMREVEMGYSANVLIYVTQISNSVYYLDFIRYQVIT